MGTAFPKNEQSKEKNRKELYKIRRPNTIPKNGKGKNFPKNGNGNSFPKNGNVPRIGKGKEGTWRIYMQHLKKQKTLKASLFVKVLGVDERRQKWIVDRDRIFYKSDKDIRLYKLGYNTVVAEMNKYEWLYEITEDEYTDLLERAKECT